MAAHRINGRGTLVVDRQFAGVGRVRRASGTQDKREFRAINDLLSTLFQRRRLDYLRAVRDGELHLMDLLIRCREQGLAALDLLPTPQALQAIEDEWTAWVDATPKAN